MLSSTCASPACALQLTLLHGSTSSSRTIPLRCGPRFLAKCRGRVWLRTTLANASSTDRPFRELPHHATILTQGISSKFRMTTDILLGWNPYLRDLNGTTLLPNSPLIVADRSTMDGPEGGYGLNDTVTTATPFPRFVPVFRPTCCVTRSLSCCHFVYMLAIRSGVPIPADCVPPERRNSRQRSVRACSLVTSATGWHPEACWPLKKQPSGLFACLNIVALVSERCM